MFLSQQFREFQTALWHAAGWTMSKRTAMCRGDVLENLTRMEPSQIFGASKAQNIAQNPMEICLANWQKSIAKSHLIQNRILMKGCPKIEPQFGRKSSKWRCGDWLRALLDSFSLLERFFHVSMQFYSILVPPGVILEALGRHFATLMGCIVPFLRSSTHRP